MSDLTNTKPELGLWPSRDLLPWPSEESPFWTGGRDGVLNLQRCNACGHWLYPLGVVCPSCWSTDLSFQPVSCRGHVHSFTVNHQPWSSTLPVPYVLAAVHLDEQDGLRVITNIVDCDIADVAVGMRVRVVFEHAGPDTWLPLFAPSIDPDEDNGA